MSNPKYEIRYGSSSEHVPHVSEISPSGDRRSNKFAVYELWAIHEDGTQVFMCAHFGGCSNMSIYQLKEYFEGLHDQAA